MMKKLLSLIFAFTLITSNLFAASIDLDNMEYSSDANAQAAYVTSAPFDETLDQSNTTNDEEQGLGDVNNDEWRVSQGFQLSGALTITSVEVKQGGSVVGSPTGNWTLRIETDSSGKPSGTLADANASIVVVPPGVNTIIKGTFATPFALSAATVYHLVIQCDNQSTNNRWTLRINTSSVYASGNMCTFADAVWTIVSTRDMYFKVYIQATTKSLQSYSESTIKTQGTYSLKGIAAITDSLNKTLTKTFSTNHNLTGVKNLRFDAYALRTGSQWKLGIHDTGGTTTEITPNIATSNTWQPVNWDLSGVSDANKDAIDTATITITNADSANTLFLDYWEIAQAIDIFGFVN